MLQTYESKIHQTRQRVASKQETFGGIICGLAMAMQRADSGTRSGLVAGPVFVILLTPFATSLLFCK